MTQEIDILKILVITPTFNRSHILLDAVNSVIHQTHKNWEYIIVDDCSDDDTKLKLNPFIEKYPNIHYVKNEVNQGTYRTRNIGLKFAIDNNISWDIFTTFDSDDFCTRERFEIVNRYFNNDQKLIGLRPNALRSDVRDLTFKSYKGLKVGSPEGTGFYSRKCFDLLGFFDDVRMGGDSEYWERCVRASKLSLGQYSCRQMKPSDPLYIAYRTPSNKNLTYTGHGFRGQYLQDFRVAHRQCSNIDCLYKNFHSNG
jgi:glycosyltransferase involved in cell wall biosynthesis